MNNSDKQAKYKIVCDSQNLQSGCNSQINLPRDRKDLSFSYS